MCEERCPCPKIWNTGTIPSIETRPHVNFQRLSPCVTKFFQSADFGRNCSIFVIFRYFWIVDIPECVQNRSELFAAKIRGPVGVERAVHMCPNRQYRSPAGGTVGTNIDKQQLNNKLSRIGHWFNLITRIIEQIDLHLQIHASEFPLCIFRGPVVAAPLLHEKNIDFRSILAKTAHVDRSLRPDFSLQTTPEQSKTGILSFSTFFYVFCSYLKVQYRPKFRRKCRKSDHRVRYPRYFNSFLVCGYKWPCPGIWSEKNKLNLEGNVYVQF